MDNSMSSSSCSWRRDKLHSPHKSLWLRTTLSESDMKMKAVMTLLEEAEYKSFESNHTFDKRKPELIQVLEDFNRSYRSLAEHCDQLRFKSHHFPRSGSSSTYNYSNKMEHPRNNHKMVTRSFNDPKLETSDSQSDFVVEDPDVECSSANFHFEYLNRLADELMSSERCHMTMRGETEMRDDEKKLEIKEFPNKEDMKMNGYDLSHAMIGQFVTNSSGWKNTWHELKFQLIKLMEESLRQQAELLKRNDEKRKVIHSLQAEIHFLRSENRALHSAHRFSKVEVINDRTPRFSGRSFNKFFKAGCS